VVRVDLKYGGKGGFWFPPSRLKQTKMKKYRTTFWYYLVAYDSKIVSTFLILFVVYGVSSYFVGDMTTAIGCMVTASLVLAVMAYQYIKEMREPRPDYRKKRKK
jgi:hypothetical protein